MEKKQGLNKRDQATKILKNIENLDKYIRICTEVSLVDYEPNDCKLELWEGNEYIITIKGIPYGNRTYTKRSGKEILKRIKEKR